MIKEYWINHKMRVCVPTEKQALELNSQYFGLYKDGFDKYVLAGELFRLKKEVEIFENALDMIKNKWDLPPKEYSEIATNVLNQIDELRKAFL